MKTEGGGAKRKKTKRLEEDMSAMRLAPIAARNEATASTVLYRHSLALRQMPIVTAVNAMPTVHRPSEARAW